MIKDDLKFKVGDTVICRKTCIMQDGHITTTPNKRYHVIENTENTFVILDDEHDRHRFYMESEYFYSPLQIIRKEKLKKINKLTSQL